MHLLVSVHGNDRRTDDDTFAVISAILLSNIWLSYL